MAYSSFAQSEVTRNLKDTYKDAFKLFFYHNTLEMLASESEELKELIKDIDKVMVLRIDKEKDKITNTKHLKGEYLEDGFTELMSIKQKEMKLDIMLKETKDKTEGIVMVINELSFSRGLKERIKYQRLILQVEVDPERVTAQKNTKARKVLSIKETYDLMKSTNPLVEDLRSRFDLKIDQ